MIHVGDCLSILPTLPERSVHTCISSPPYFGLRSYGIGAENGEIGCEPTPDLFVTAMVRVFQEVKRVLRADGTCFLNLGDSYGPDKQELMIPHRVALALQANGWICRSTIIWHKPSPMPESVRDRPTKSHEYLFLLTKSPRYYWDAEAVREPVAASTLGRDKYTRITKGKDGPYAVAHDHETPSNPAGRNIRSVWTLSTKSFRGAHFAVMPPKLVEPCIKAGTSERGCCPGCKKPWVRVVERTATEMTALVCPKSQVHQGRGGKSSGAHEPGWRKRRMASSTTTGWRPDCECHGRFMEIESDPGTHRARAVRVYVANDDAPPPIPCTVLDPFAGAGTTGLVAKQLGRSFVGCELNPDYAAMAEARIAKGA